MCSCDSITVHVEGMAVVGHERGGEGGGGEGDCDGGGGGDGGRGEGNSHAHSRSYEELLAAQDIDEVAPIVHIPTQAPPQHP